MARHKKPPRVGDAPIFRRLLIATVLILVALVVVAPLAVIGVQAVSKGIGYFAKTIAQPDTRHAILLTVVTVLSVRATR